MLLLILACAPSPEADSGDPVDTAVADTAADTAAEDTGTPRLLDWGDGEPSCNWFYAAAPLGAHAMYIADLLLPEADFDAGVDVAYDRPLVPGEVVVWYDDAATDVADVFACSDVEYRVVGRRVEVVSGRLVLDAVATGPDPVCGNPQTYAVTWSLTELETAEGPIADIGPSDGTAGFFGECYG